MTMVYVTIFLTGMAGNMAVCLVIVKHRSMHTATNYYLFSLAVADLVISMQGLANELAIYLQWYPLGPRGVHLQGQVPHIRDVSSPAVLTSKL